MDNNDTSLRAAVTQVRDEMDYSTNFRIVTLDEIITLKHRWLRALTAALDAAPPAATPPEPPTTEQRAKWYLHTYKNWDTEVITFGSLIFLMEVLVGDLDSSVRAWLDKQGKEADDEG
jgi:hypothetical protein